MQAEQKTWPHGSRPTTVPAAKSSRHTGQVLASATSVVAPSLLLSTFTSLGLFGILYVAWLVNCSVTSPLSWCWARYGDAGDGDAGGCRAY
ncbi:hypothetical protein ColKHC_05551 [Colletotrichum higginsianum]|nr:hypothetical protein ColKHC_05551 [Colletotrichum higginsianum]